MKHDSIKSMVFYFLERIDYNQSWDKVESDIGYDMGDFDFGNKPEIRKRLDALQNRTGLNCKTILTKPVTNESKI